MLDIRSDALDGHHLLAVSRSSVAHCSDVFEAKLYIWTADGIKWLRKKVKGDVRDAMGNPEEGELVTIGHFRG